MTRATGIGYQDFGQLITRDIFYIDKTHFIKEWWNNGDNVTLITRPRRFGKTLNMSMLDYFFQSIMPMKKNYSAICLSGRKKSTANCMEPILLSS